MAKPAFRFVACPFCGSDDKFGIENNADPGSMTYWVTCFQKGCESDGPWRKSEEAAVEAWNARGGSADA